MAFPSRVIVSRIKPSAGPSRVRMGSFWDTWSGGQNSGYGGGYTSSFNRSSGSPGDLLRALSYSGQSASLPSIPTFSIPRVEFPEVPRGPSIADTLASVDPRAFDVEIPMISTDGEYVARSTSPVVKIAIGVAVLAAVSIAWKKFRRRPGAGAGPLKP